MQLKDLKEARLKAQKESERLEKEIAEVQELKVNKYFIFFNLHIDVHTQDWESIF